MVFPQPGAAQIRRGIPDPLNRVRDDKLGGQIKEASLCNWDPAYLFASLPAD